MALCEQRYSTVSTALQLSLPLTPINNIYLSNIGSFVVH